MPLPIFYGDHKDRYYKKNQIKEFIAEVQRNLSAHNNVFVGEATQKNILSLLKDLIIFQENIDPRRSAATDEKQLQKMLDAIVKQQQILAQQSLYREPRELQYFADAIDYVKKSVQLHAARLAPITFEKPVKASEDIKPVALTDKIQIIKQNVSPTNPTGALGHGAFGYVYLAKVTDPYLLSALRIEGLCPPDDDHIIIKQSKDSKKNDPSELDAGIIKEGTLGEKVRKAAQKNGIVGKLINATTLGSLKDSEGRLRPVVIGRYEKQGVLADYLATKRKSSADEKIKLLLDLWEQQMQGLMFLHYKANILHRDLAVRNVLIDENGQAKLSDMGLAKEINENPDALVENKEASALQWSDAQTLLEKQTSRAGEMISFKIALLEGLGIILTGNTKAIWGGALTKEEQQNPMLVDLTDHFQAVVYHGANGDVGYINALVTNAKYLLNQSESEAEKQLFGNFLAKFSLFFSALDYKSNKPSTEVQLAFTEFYKAVISLRTEYELGQTAAPLYAPPGWVAPASIAKALYAPSGWQTPEQSATVRNPSTKVQLGNYREIRTKEPVASTSNQLIIQRLDAAAKTESQTHRHSQEPSTSPAEKKTIPAASKINLTFASKNQVKQTNTTFQKNLKMFKELEKKAPEKPPSPEQRRQKAFD